LGFEKPQAEPWAKAAAQLGLIHGFQEQNVIIVRQAKKSRL